MFRHATRLISCILLISVLFMFSACGSIVIYNTTAENEERSHGLSLFCPMSEDFAYPEEETEFETWRKLTAFD